MLKGVLYLADGLKGFKVTWKKDEKWLCDYAWEHSSPPAWIKDLIKAEYKRTHGETSVQEVQKPMNTNIFDL